MEIFKLFGTILVDSSKAEESISKTEKKAEGFGSKLGSGIKTAGKWALGVGAAAVAVGGAMVGVAAQAADAAGEIDDMAQRTGTSAEEFQKYAYAAKLSGMETATLESAMIKAQKSFTDAKEGSKGASEAFSKLGLDIESMSSEEAFDKVIMSLADMEDTTARNAIANDIFGKSYAELAPMLNSGSDGIKALKDEAVKLGGVMSNDSVAAGAEFGDMMDKTKTAMGGVFNELGVMLLPLLTEFLNWVLEHMPEIQATIKTVFEVIGGVVSAAGEIFDALMPILEPLWSFISTTFPLIADVTKTAFDAVVTVIEGVAGAFELVTGAIKTALDWLGLWNKEPVQDKEPKPVSKTPGNRRVNRAELDGSHASGLAYVPYDGYVAELHKGERVVPASQNNQATTVNHTGTIKVEGINNRDELVAVVEQNITNSIMSGNRRMPNRTSLIPI